jgi:GTP:adenosylcobinamide-phosphate guanylyltransferase
VRAVITAGGTVDGEFASEIGTTIKALAPFASRTLLDVVLDACAGAGIGEAAVIGGPAVRAHLRGAGVRVIDAAADGGINVLRALDAWPGEPFAYLSSDLPFVAADGLRDFIERSRAFAVTMALASEAAYRTRFPGAAPHGVTLRRERIVNGSAFVLGANAAAPARALAVRLFDARKSLFGLARLLGPQLCVRFLTRRLAVSDIEAYGTRVLHLPVGAVRDCDPGLCYDIDSLEDYRAACSLRA